MALPACERIADAPPPIPDAPPVATPAVSSPELTRSDLIEALALAASAHAAGEPETAGAQLSGRTFSIRAPFGCFGPLGDDATPEAASLGGEGLAEWQWSDDGRSQILSLRPADWTRSRLVGATDASEWERVDGYWIPRPWLASDACPATPSATAPPDSPAGTAELPQTPSPVPAPFTAGIAAIQSAEDSRLGRRSGDAYRFIVRSPAGDPPLAAPRAGYRLVLQGRISKFPDGRPVHCSASSPNRRPTCIVAAVLDGVRFETSEGTRLSEWRPG